MVLEPIKCPSCGGIDVGKHGKTTNGKQRFLCKESDCEEKTFIRDYSEKGRLPEVKRKIIEMAVNGSGIRETARVLDISTATVINELKKKEPELQSVNQAILDIHSPEQIVVDIIKIDENHEVNDQEIEVEMDEMWSYVGSKANQRWLWHAIDRATGDVLAYVFGRRKDEVFLKLKDLLEPFGRGVTRFPLLRRP